MKVQCLWYGGSCYSCPGANDVEDFDSLKQSKWAYEARRDNDSGHFPCVDESEMHVYFGEYTENGPDRIIKSGPRGGTVIERA